MCLINIEADQKESKCRPNYLKPDNILTEQNGKYSSLVAVGRIIQVNKDGTVTPFCTGTKLKDKYTILTAAHCFLEITYHDKKQKFYAINKSQQKDFDHLRFCPVYSQSRHGDKTLKNYKWCIPVDYVYVKIVLFHFILTCKSLKLFIDNSFVFSPYQDALVKLTDIYNKAKNDEQRKFFQHMANEDFRDNHESLKNPLELFKEETELWFQAVKYRETVALYDFAAFRLNEMKTKSSKNVDENVNNKLSEMKGLDWQIISKEQYEHIYNRKYTAMQQKSPLYTEILSKFATINQIYDIQTDSQTMPKDKLIQGTSLNFMTAGYPDWSNGDMAMFDYTIDYSDDTNKIRVKCIRYLDEHLGYHKKKTLLFPIPFSPVCVLHFL